MSKLRVGIVICSSSDLPPRIIDENDINIMPINLKMKKETLIDRRDPLATKAFYRNYLKNKSLHAESVPYTPDEITKWFLDELVLKYDRILVLNSLQRTSSCCRY